VVEAAIEQGIAEMVETARQAFGDRLRRVVLYGSYARGDYDAESDVDLLIVADSVSPEARDELVHAMSELCIRMGRLIVPSMLDTARWEWLVEEEAPIALNIMREGRVVWPASAT
jgi:predicted nucleotidyltransferase